MAKKEIPRKDDGGKGISQTTALMLGKPSEIQLPAGLTASADLFTQNMTPLFESTSISDGKDYYKAGQSIPDEQLLRPMQTRSLSSIEVKLALFWSFSLLSLCTSACFVSELSGHTAFIFNPVIYSSLTLFI
ncbi:hypothetical protein HOLleu_28085 [Holothuria leucospilota]|uniref:Uncharacterized protein n=1 Tax=Holothuria leucospilota TaxID=206669 RepID=A0A9Q1BRK0_HOLLE|nr:hypothetical protein HOLleu_28085 [Holothuria leucospilota]